MKLIDKIAQRDPRRLFYMFEFFPPKTDEVHTPARAVCRPQPRELTSSLLPGF